MRSRVISSLDALMDGEVRERFEREFNRVLANVLDERTAADAKRSVTIKVEIKPTKYRESAEFRVEVSSRMAAPMAMEQMVLLERGPGGGIQAREISELEPGQLDMEGRAAQPRVVAFGGAMDMEEKAYRALGGEEAEE